MPVRSRSSVTMIPRGVAQRSSPAYYNGGNDITGYSSVCDDIVATSSDCDAFNVHRLDRSGAPRMNRPYTSASQPVYQDYIPDYFVQSWPFGHLSVSGLKSDSAYATELAARTNPSAPYVDVPVALLELGDYTQLIRDTGRAIISGRRRRNRGASLTLQAARANLGWQFGLGPLLSDLDKLTQFRQAFKQRVAVVKKLQGPRGLRRTVELDIAGAYWVGQIVAQSNMGIVRLNERVNTKVSKRGHIRWRAAGFTSRLPPDDPEMERAIRRALLGLTVDMSTVWEALPWSWLIDWGSTIGSYFKANRNIIPATLEGIWIHTHRSTEVKHAGTTFDNGVGHCSSGICRVETKNRGPSVPVTATAHFPFLDGRQVGILASLAVARR